MSSEVEIIAQLTEHHKNLKKEIANTIVGQEDVIDTILSAIYCGGHSLLIGVPGLAKTLIVQTISKALGLDFKRVQFTPDLMPSDIIGSEILDEDRHFKFLKGPIFSNIVLADEINRTPPKTQSALLEAMQERLVTVSGKPYKLPEPFFVLATQNPIEQEGTYPLPEAQLDRFMFAVELKYPDFKDEVSVVKSTTIGNPHKTKAVFKEGYISAIQKAIRQIPVPDNVVEYAVSINHKTRPDTEYATDMVNRYVSWGSGPRASQNLILAAKAHASIKGKFSPDKEDVNAVAHDILRHRILRNYKADAEGITIDEIINTVL